MSSDSRGIGEEVIEDAEPEDECPFENVEAVGEERCTEEVADRTTASAVASAVYGVESSMFIFRGRSYCIILRFVT